MSAEPTHRRHHDDGSPCDATHRVAIRRDGSHCLVTTYADPDQVRLPAGWAWADEPVVTR